MLTANERDTILDAMRAISEKADELKAGCAIGDEWPDAEDKAIYDADVRLVGRLRAMLDAALINEQTVTEAVNVANAISALAKSEGDKP